MEDHSRQEGKTLPREYLEHDTFAQVISFRNDHVHNSALVEAWKEETGKDNEWKIELERIGRLTPEEKENAKSRGFTDDYDLYLYELAHICQICNEQVALEICSIERCGKPEIYMERYK
jgi:hypothetical protein